VIYHVIDKNFSTLRDKFSDDIIAPGVGVFPRQAPQTRSLAFFARKTRSKGPAGISGDGWSHGLSKLLASVSTFAKMKFIAVFALAGLASAATDDCSNARAIASSVDACEAYKTCLSLGNSGFESNSGFVSNDGFASNDGFVSNSGFASVCALGTSVYTHLRAGPQWTP
jgi:hypothetical protein